MPDMPDQGNRKGSVIPAGPNASNLEADPTLIFPSICFLLALASSASSSSFSLKSINAA